MWYLEKNKLISPRQNGFHKNRSTIDHLVHFESLLREASIKNLHIVAIFFDIEKAYDTNWKHGILQDLQDLHLQGHLPNFIPNFFLIDCKLSMRLLNHVSDEYQQKTGVPQGSITASYLQHCSSSKSITSQNLYLRMSITFSTSTISLSAIVLVT